MSIPNAPTPLSTATTRELIDELKRRTRDGVIIVSGHDPKNTTGYAISSWGSHLWSIGASLLIQRILLREADGKDDPEVDDT